MAADGKCIYSHIRGMMTGRVWENNRIADDSWDDSKKSMDMYGRYTKDSGPFVGSGFL